MFRWNLSFTFAILFSLFLPFKTTWSIEMKRNNSAKLRQLIPTNFQHQTKEFFSNSTLHGVRYIAEKDRSFGEKFMWFCCVAIGAVAAFVIIDSLWEKFQTNPTITGMRSCCFKNFSSGSSLIVSLFFHKIGWFRARHRFSQSGVRVSNGNDMPVRAVWCRRS